MRNMKTHREQMVESQIEARGIRDPLTLEAMRTVPREVFIPASQATKAYDDCPVPLAEGQTISQPYIVALMVEALNITPAATVLEIGSGSGYAAAILGSIARSVHTIERIGTLAETARLNLENAGFDNVHVHHSDGTNGWPDAAPYDAILVSAAGGSIPDALKYQLKTNGTLVIPIGPNERTQEIIRIVRTGPESFTQEDIADVRFVPLLTGKVGSHNELFDTAAKSDSSFFHKPLSVGLENHIRRYASEFTGPQSADLQGIIQRAGDKRIVLVGEASHGTHEFYELRNMITKALIEQRGFNVIAIEADWPDARAIDDYVRGRIAAPEHWQAFARFPIWMWRNSEVADFTEWLRRYNDSRQPEHTVAFYGLDLYSLYNSASLVISYLDTIDPEAGELARQRYGCLPSWQSDPAAYGQKAVINRLRSCEAQVIRMLADIFQKKSEYHPIDPEGFLDVTRNAHLVLSAEKYYRAMYYGSRAAWNIRDNHMFQTLEAILEHHGSEAKIIIWAHNSHIGDARFTDMSERGEINLGELCAKGYGQQSWRIGMGMHEGTVAASSGWNQPMEHKQVPPSHPDSHEYLFHLTGIDAAIMPLHDSEQDNRSGLFRSPRLQRAIGVVYNPESERANNYVKAELFPQFNEYIWFRKTTPVKVLKATQVETMPDTYPFGV